MERLLSEAAAELAIRSEVEATLNSALHDVEHARALEESLRAHNELHRCREQLAALKVRYDDREAAWEADRREKERLGMSLLEEIVRLSAREVEGERSRREIDSKLLLLEEEKRMAGGNFSVQQPKQIMNQNTVDDVDGGVCEHDSSQTAMANEDGEKKVLQPVSDKALDDPEVKQVISDTTTNNTTEANAAGGGDCLSTDSSAKHGSNNVHNNPSGGDATEETNQGLSTPHKLEETALMNIFAYLDPVDVMNFAQTNKALLSKVNVMFGMGSGEESDVDQEQHQQQQQHSVSGEDTAATSGKDQTELTYSQPMSENSVSDPPTNVQAVLPSTPATETTSTASATSGTKSSPKLAGLSGPSHKRQGSGVSVATAGSAGTANPFSQVSSWFGASASAGTADASSIGSAPTAANSTSSASSAPADAGSSEIKLNAAMANSMASKLTPSELSIILRMREKLQKCELDANKWRLEKEEAMGNLASVEAVKEFLVARVRDTERVVQKQKEEMGDVQKKMLEDQEVIVFLDERVKGLEKVLEETKTKEATTKKESMDIVNKNEKKARVLSDMLRFEREQMVANEKEWKTAKKVLVKEVKSCRARIVALEAEAEGCRQQNARLKQGLMSLQSSGQMSPKGRKSLKGIGRF